MCPSTSRDRHVGLKPNGHRSQDRDVLASVYDPRTSRRPKPNRHRSQDHAVLCSHLRPENVPSAQVEQSPVPRPCRARSVYDPRTSRRPKPNSHRSPIPCRARFRLRPENVTSPPPPPNRTVACPKTVSCSVPVYVPSTSRRPKPNSRRSQDRVVLCFRQRPENVASAQANSRRSQDRPVLCSVYDPRTSRRPKPNSRRSQDRVVPCIRLRPKHVTSAQAEQPPVPRPCLALFPSTPRERHVSPIRAVGGPKTVSCSVPVYVPRRHVGPSRTVTGPKTVPCSVPGYVPSTSRRPKRNSRRSQDRAVLCFRLLPENVTSAQAEQSPVPRPCRALFPSTSRGHHVGPSRKVAGPKTVLCSVSVYVPRTSRRPKPNSRRSQDHIVLCSRLRPEHVASAQAEQSPVTRPCRALFPSTSRERHVGPSRTVAGPKTTPCPVSIYVPRTARRPKPNSRRSQDHAVPCFHLRPEDITSAQAEKSPVPRPCCALFPSTSRERHVGPSRTVAGPKTMSCSVPGYVPSTSRRPKPNSHRSQDRAVLCFRLRPENVTSAQAEQSPVPRPRRALFPSTSRERHVGPSRTVVGPKTMPCPVSIYVPRTSRRPKPNSHRPQDRAVLCFRLRPENVTSAQAEQSPAPRPCRALFRLRPENVTSA